MRSTNKIQRNTARFVFVTLGITVFTAFKPIMLFMSLEKWASWSGFGLNFGFGLGLGLALAKVVSFTPFKPLKLLVSFEKSASCSFHCGTLTEESYHLQSCPHQTPL